MESGTQPKRLLKRARPVHSCLHCRSKKLKCDRQTPCQMCSKSGRANECAYDANSGSLSKSLEQDERPPQFPQAQGAGASVEDSIISRQLSNDSSRVVHDLQCRVARLESLIERSLPGIPANGVRANGNPAGEDLAGAVEVKKGSSRYRPQMHKASLLGLFDDAKKFIIAKAANNNSSMLLLKSLRQHFPKRRLYQRSINDGLDDLGSKMVSLIPVQEECTRLVRVYFEHYERLYQVLDPAAFQEACIQFFSLSVEEQTRSEFMPCLLIVVSLASVVDPQRTGATPHVPCDLVDTWISGLLEKKLLEIANLQLQTLFVLGLQAAAAPSDRVWRATGNLIRSAMIAGLHHEPRRLKDQLDPLAEHRRRLWIAAVELDLQASLVCGLPPAVCHSDYSSATTTLRPEDRLLKALGSSLPMRLESARLMRLAECDETKILANLTAIEKLQNTEQIAANSLAGALAITYLYRSVIALCLPLLHGPNARQARTSSTESSLKVLSHLKKLRAHEWMQYFIIASQDLLQAALMVCLTIHNTSRPQNGAMARGAGDSWDTGMLVQVVEDTLQALARGISVELLGNYLKDLIALAVVIGSVRQPGASQHDAMEADFSTVVEALLQRAGEANSLVRLREDVSSRSTPLPPPPPASEMDTGSLLAQQFDLDFEAAFGQSYDLDPRLFQFDTETQMDASHFLWNG